MKKLILCTVLCTFLCTGCITGLLNKVPNNEFTKFVYNRTGNVTSARITAENAKKVDDSIVAESLSIQENWRPAISFDVTIEGYKRTME